MPTIRVGNTDTVCRIAGDGPVTVFVVPGLGLAGAEWCTIQDALAGRAKVVVWDRAGCGDSGPPASARTPANIAHEALDVLAALAPRGPVVLVGHSQGGLYVNALARLAAERVRGLVLLDPVHADNVRLRRELPADLFRRSGCDLAVRLRMARTLTRLRLTGIAKPLLMRNPPLSFCREHPAEAIEGIWRHLARTQTYDTALAEYHQLETATNHDDLAQFGPFPDIAVITLVHDPAVMIDQFVRLARRTRQDAERVESLWGKLLRDDTYCGQSATIETVTGAGHLIHLQQPSVVLAAITRLVNEARG